MQQTSHLNDSRLMFRHFDKETMINNKKVREYPVVSHQDL